MLRTKFFIHADWPKHLVLLVFMASGTLIIFSNLIFGYRRIISPEIVFIYILPCLMLASFLYFDILLSKTYKIEIIFMSLIIIFGIINVYLSDNIYQSSIWMTMFLLSGIMPLWTSMFVITDDRSRNKVNYLSCFLLFVIAIIEIANYFITGGELLSINHPIPLGTLVILLMVGPLYMLLSGQKRVKLFSIFLVIMGLILLIIANKRGIYLAIAGMTAAWILYRYVRSSFYVSIILIICLTLLAAGWNYYKTLDENIPYHNSILHRLELYPFSLHIYQKHPFLGTGLRAFSHESYLIDYEVHNKSLDTFKETVIKLQTFDNMILTGLVELGLLMTICYLGLILYIIVRYCRITQPFSLNHKKEFVLLLPLLGLAIHSLTYDSLMFPQINWLFHVQLGTLAGFSPAEPQGPASPTAVA